MHELAAHGVALVFLLVLIAAVAPFDWAQVRAALAAVSRGEGTLATWRGAILLPALLIAALAPWNWRGIRDAWSR